MSILTRRCILKNLTEGNLLHNLIKYSLPIILGDLVQATFSSVDALWVGRLIGADALAAVSAVGPVMFLIIALVIGIAIATVIMVGQAYGMGDTEYLRKILVNSYMVIFLMCVVISTVAIIFSGPLLEALNTPAAIKKDAQTFMVIIFSGLIFMFSFNWFAGVLRGVGDSRTPFILQVSSIVLNVILAPILITGALGLPKLGIAGSALATVLSQTITTIAAFIYLSKKNILLNMFKWDFKPDFTVIKKMFTIGTPVSIQLVINALSGVVIVSFVNRFGPDVIAGFGLGMRIDQFSFMPAMSLGEAVSAMVAQHIGAGKENKIPEILRNAIFISLGIALLFYLPVNLMPHQIASLFNGREGVLDASKWYWRIDSLTYFAFAILFAFQGVIRGAGDTIPLTVIAFITLIIFRAGITWGLVEHTQLHQLGIWIAMAISAYIGALLSFLYYKYGNWKEKALVNMKTTHIVDDRKNN
jgi:putative MATE family efflux protein